MAAKVYIYESPGINPTVLGRLISDPAPAFTIESLANPTLTAIGIDSAFKADLDGAMLDLGYTFVAELDPGDPLPGTTERPCEAAALVGDLVFFDPVDAQYERVLTTSAGPAVGYISAKATPAAVTAFVLSNGEIHDILDDTGAALVPGTAYYVSPTVPGRVTATITAQRVGIATDAGALLFAPEPGSPSQGSSGDNLARHIWLWG